jgi:hypothetical protein
VNIGGALGRVLGLARSPWVRWGFGVVAATLAVWAVVSRRHAVADAAGRLDWRYLVLAALATLANLALTGMVWRALLTDLGSTLPIPAAVRVFFVGQIGKYMPGSLWPMVVQAELARDHGVPRRRSAAATLVLILLSAASGLLVVLAAVPFVPSVVESGFGWALLLVVPLLVVLHPAVLGPLLDRLLRVIGGEPLEQRPSMVGTLVATAWAIGSWVTAGLQVFLLAVPLGAPADAHTLALSVGGYALAWAVGLVVVVAPAGAGARELALAAVLSAVLDGGAVVVVVLLSRVLFSAADLALAGVGLAVGRNPAKPPAE